MVFASRVGGHIAFHSKEMVFRHNGTIYDLHVEGEREDMPSAANDPFDC